MKLVNLLRPSILEYLTKTTSAKYSTEFFPYTQELHKKNYIRWKVQSKSGVTHDYVYHGDERLPSFDEKIKEFGDPLLHIYKNIGKKVQHPKLSEIKRELDAKISSNEKDRLLELESIDLKLKLPIDSINRDTKIISNFETVFKMGKHYNIFKDLFEQAYFKPSLDINVEYHDNNVYYGNKILASRTAKAPKVKIEDLFESNKDGNSYHTLLFVNLDGNFHDSSREVLQWFVGNIKGGDLSSGNELVEYCQPFPMRGTGWHRCVYVLFEHENPIDFKIDYSGVSKLNKRDFKVSDFYLNNQESITPVGLAFFQTEWDLSVKDLFHNYLGMKEPVYEYEFEKQFIPKYEKYPENQPFNWYLSDYMDQKRINEDVVKDYIKNLSPFEPYPEPAKYPLIDVPRNDPKWYRYEVDNYRKRRQQFSQIPYKYYSPNTKIRDQIKHLPYQQK